MDRKTFLEAIERFITANRLMHKDRLYLTALSGGADSVALTLALSELGYRVEAAHCNFHLRGGESDRDEQFCIALCKSKGIEIHIVHFDTAEYARLHKQSIEMAARNLRYAYFEQLRNDIGAEGICVGHHREDSVETLLINLTRGTGINGLTGIAPKNGFILRPMLNVARADIEDYLRELGQPFVTDSTNLVDDVTRNKIRLNLMPIIRGINPSADRDMAATARRMSEAAKVFNDALDKAVKEVTLSDTEEQTVVDVARLEAQVSPEYTLYSIMSRFSFSPSAIEDFFEKMHTVQTGKVFASTTHRMTLDRGRIIIEPIAEGEKKTMTVPECGTYCFSEELKLKFSVSDIDGAFRVCRDSHTATFDAALVKFPLKIRHAERGDWFVPFGMKGKKLVSDFLTDRKFSVFDKERQLVVTDADGNIIWIVGIRPDNRFRITEKSEKALTVRIVK